MSDPQRPGNWKPTAGMKALRARGDLLARIRAFFTARNVLEVETPALSHAGNSDPGLDPLPVDRHGMWLRTSPEYAMKRLLAAGSGDIFELGRVFRGGESGRHHNIEFTMLEWYRTGWTYHRLMDEVAELLRFCLPERPLRERRLSYRDLFRSNTGIDPFSAGAADLEEYAHAKGIDAPSLDRGEWLDLVLSHVIQPCLPADTLTFVFDYPPEQAALARIRRAERPVAERFELFLGSTELANGYQELTEAGQQRQRFEHENAARIAQGGEAVRLDQHLLDALASGLPECAGVALGVDRLLMHHLDAQSLDEVIAFPARRA